MLIQEKISGADTLLKLYIATDEDLKALHPQLQAKQFPRDLRGGAPSLSAAEVLTILVWGAWRGLTDKAKLYFHAQTYHRGEFPTLGAYSKFVEATNRYSVELHALLALLLHCNAGPKGRIRSCSKTLRQLLCIISPVSASIVSFGRGVYLYRAIDRNENLVTVLLSERQDQVAAEAFFRSARTLMDRIPARVTTDSHSPYPGAIKAELGEAVTHRTNRYLKNHVEQDHRGIEQRTHSMCGFKSFASAARFCRVYDEVCQFFRARSQQNEAVSLV